MDTHGIAPSPINNEKDFLAHLDIVHGAMRQYMNGDRDRELVYSIAKHFQYVILGVKELKKVSIWTMFRSKRKITYVAEGLKFAYEELVASGDLPRISEHGN